MPKLEIEFLHDDYDCDDCGYSYSEGCRVHLDGNLILELNPVAHCFGGIHYDTNEMYNLLLEKLGYEVLTK